MAQRSDQLIQRLGMLVSLAVAAFLVAHSINAFVADALHIMPEPRVGSGAQESAGSVTPTAFSPVQYAEDVRSSGLFVLPPPPPPQETLQGSGTQGGRPGTPVRASLGAASKIRVIGVVMGDRQGIFAIVEEQASKTQVLYRLHDQIPDLGEVVDIQRNGILIRQGNLEELVSLDLLENPQASGNGAAAPASKASSPRVQASGPSMKKIVDRREVEQAMNDLPKLMTQARAIPNMVNGTINGFRLDYVAPASFYEKIGVQKGDILQRVNGVDIRDPGTILSMLQQLKNEEVVKLDIVRNNQRSTVTYELR